jgi:hypothetical protein
MRRSRLALANYSTNCCLSLPIRQPDRINIRRFTARNDDTGRDRYRRNGQSRNLPIATVSLHPLLPVALWQAAIWDFAERAKRSRSVSDLQSALLAGQGALDAPRGRWMGREIIESALARGRFLRARFPAVKFFEPRKDLGEIPW